MKDNIIIVLLLVFIALFILQYHNASPYITQGHLNDAVSQSMEEYLQLNGYAE